MRHLASLNLEVGEPVIQAWGETLSKQTAQLLGKYPIGPVEPPGLSFVQTPCDILGRVSTAFTPDVESLVVVECPLRAIPGFAVTLIVRSNTLIDNPAEAASIARALLQHLHVTASLRTSAGRSIPLVLQCSVVDAGVPGVRIIISPTWSMMAECPTDILVPSPTFAGKTLPATPIVISVGANHEPAVAGRLYDAIERGSFSGAVAALLDGCSTEERTVTLAFPLMLSCVNGRTDLVRLLMRVGASASAVGEYGWTALHFAVQFNCAPEVVELLLADPTVDVNKSVPGHIVSARRCIPRILCRQSCFHVSAGLAAFTRGCFQWLHGNRASAPCRSSCGPDCGVRFRTRLSHVQGSFYCARHGSRGRAC